MRVIGTKIYEVCGNCGKIVCFNKFFFGSMHVCTTEEERQSQHVRDIIQEKVVYMQKRLAES